MTSQKEFFTQLKVKDQGNEFCFDCQTKDATWISVNNGVFLCAGCASKHQELGDQISFVKNIEGGNLSSAQLDFLIKGGNTNMANFFAAYDLNE